MNILVAVFYWTLSWFIIMSINDLMTKKMNTKKIMVLILIQLAIAITIVTVLPVNPQIK
jgi:hypothetical protein